MFNSAEGRVGDLNLFFMDQSVPLSETISRKVRIWQTVATVLFSANLIRLTAGFLSPALFISGLIPMLPVRSMMVPRWKRSRMAFIGMWAEAAVPSVTWVAVVSGRTEPYPVSLLVKTPLLRGGVFVCRSVCRNGGPLRDNGRAHKTRL